MAKTAKKVPPKKTNTKPVAKATKAVTTAFTFTMSPAQRARLHKKAKKAYVASAEYLRNYIDAK